MTPPPDLPARLADLAIEAGRADLAGDLLRRAAALPPVPAGATAAAAHQAGLNHLSAGRFAEAEAALLLAIRLAPGTAAIHDHLGVALANQQRYAEAAATFGLAARLAPGDPSPRRNRVQACLDGRDFAGAASAARDALELEPDAEALVLHLAVALTGLKQFAAAAAALAPLAAGPSPSAAVWNRLGVVRGLAGDAAGAADCFRKHIDLEPESGGAYANLAAAYGKLNRWADAADAGRRAVALDPNHAGGWANLGNAYRDLGRLDDALHALQQAIRLDPTQADAVGNYALTLTMRGDPRAALPWYDRALQLKPAAPEVRFNRAVALLSLGDYAAGWKEYEWRWGTEQMRGQTRTRAVPAWRGEPLAGKTLLVYAEQGHGDTLQFIRLVTPLAAAGARIVVVAADPVRRLLATVAGVAEVVGPGDEVAGVHYQTPLLTLPLLTGLRVETIPAGVPYVTAPTDAVEKWRAPVAALPGRTVGIAWQGNPAHIGDRWRSVPLNAFAPLAAVPGVTLVSLQKGPGAEQLTDAPFPVVDLAADITGDFGDTAGLLMSLDLVVTIDSAAAHLAGALGRPAWVALPVNADWRWLRGRDDSPWHPTVKLFRQERFGEWPAVFARMAAELAAG